MPFIFKRLALFMSIAGVAVSFQAVDKDHPAFHPPPAMELPHHQTNDKVMIGADPYTAGDKMKAAFGKVNPYQYGILPVLIAIQNDSGQSIKMDGMKAEFEGPHGDRIEATPAKDVRYTQGGGPPRPPIGVIPRGVKKSPLDIWEIEGRAFAAEMIPPGNSAYGFVYFQATNQKGATIYLSGMTVAATGKELLFFEIPLQ
jgi:hypothetical protein